MRYIRVFTISLALHFAFAIFLAMMPEPKRLDLRPTTYVELLDKPELPTRPHQPPRDEKQFVRSTAIPQELVSKEKKKARFASEEERYVLEETRARATDMTANRSSMPAGQSAPLAKSLGPKVAQRRIDFRPKSALQKIQQKLHDELKSSGDAGDILVGKPKKSDETLAAGGKQLSPNFGGLESGVSTLGETVPDEIKFGDLTALNTDRHLFYTYYARMEEKIRFRWVNYARAAVFSMAADPRKATGRDNWVTRLEVLLDKDGNYVRSILHSSSGIQSLDQAPLQAFRDARQFPHPPPEMVKGDGLIHIYYSFNVNASSYD